VDSPSSGSAAPPAAPSGAPPVVAVVVARDPGAWFEECIESLTLQDYGNLSVLVVDVASDEPVKPRVGAVAPSAYVRRIDDNPGYGAATNEVLDVVEGASFFLLCHDDVALEPDTVRLLVEEAFRSNAGVLGPKLVQWDDPRRLLQVGEGLDKAGYTSPLAERGELDQEQHDAVRDVFTIPGACTLVRADLFSTLGGFDEGIDYLLDDVSLCWRSHLAGARVLIAPQARVRHLEALGERRPVDDRRRLQTRHRLRVVLTCYSTLTLLRIIPQIVVLHVGEVVYSLVAGRVSHAREVGAAWVWNLRRLRDVRSARRHVKGFRTVKDREIRRLMVSGSARFSQFVRGQIGSEDRFGGVARTGRGVVAAARRGTLRVSLAVWGAVALVLLAGSRHLITRGVPAIGEMVPFHSTPVDLFREWASGWRSAGLGSEAPSPTALGVLSGLGAAFLGAMGTLRLVLTLGLLPLGALAAYRLPAPTGSRRAQIAALLLYVAVPLPYNALAAGHWSALAVYAATPILIGQLARVGRLAPFGANGGDPGPRVRSHPLWRHVVTIGFVTALVAALLPAAVAIVAVLALALGVGSVLALTTRGSVRLLAGGLGGAAAAAVLHLPWSLDFVLPGSTLSAFLGTEQGAGRYELQDLLRFDTGELGSGPLGWAFLVAAALPLLIGREWRLAWAIRAWTVAIAFWGLAWVGQEDWLSFGLPKADVLLAPAAGALALSAGLGVVAFELDLPGYRFGWRQLASGGAAIAVVVALLPVVGGAIDGGWSAPSGDHARALGSIDEARDDEPFRVLWIGDPEVLPLGSWELTDGLAYATTDDGTPDIEDLWAGSDDGPTRLIADALELAAGRETARLGRLLAPMAIRYIAVVERPAPAPFSEVTVPVPARYSDAIGVQLDLRRIDRPAGLRLYENEAYAPERSQLPAGTVPDDGGLLGGLDLDLRDATAVLPQADGEARWRGDLEPGQVFHSMAASTRWELDVAGRGAPRTKALGWANAYDVDVGGSATLRYRTPILRYLVLLLQALLWLWALRVVIRMRGTGELAVSVPPRHGTRARP
jgi:GT2 family glycosyltransferase